MPEQPPSALPTAADWPAVAQSVIDALDAEVAVLDRVGIVVATNLAWETRATHGPNATGAWVGGEPDGDLVSSLGAAAPSSVSAREALAGLTSVLGGSEREFRLEYDAEVAGEPRRYHVSVTRLPGGIHGALVTHEDVTRRRSLEGEIAEHATHDALTGLPNRMLLDDRLRGALLRAQRSGRTVAVMFAGLDAFKAVNDALGHAAGDLVLGAVAQRLARACRSSDTVARFGGDEFVLVVDDVDGSENVHLVAQRLLDALAAPIVVEGSELYVTASIGVAIASAGLAPTAATAADLVRDADTAMFQAKSGGRNRYVVFEPAMRARVTERLATANALRQGVARGELRVAYQPVFSCADDSVVGAEALVRWLSPERGLVQPAQFLDAAEDSGLIVEIGEWVLDQACRQMSVWESIAPVQFRIGVNLSPRQLSDPNVAGMFRAVAARYGVDPHRIVVEIGERALADDPETAERTLHNLLGHGVRVAVDNFGTGFAPLAHLQRFPVGALKIDRFFVTRLGTDRTAESLVRGVVALAHALDLETVAEGVENDAQRAAVAALGCDYYQGFLRARPGTPEVVTGLLESTTGVTLLRRP
ncbi:MAG: putative bifunctional diguanylate cyclase/phosphodiesterase [Candidatus Nanopelagicales bacterium]